MRKSIKIAAALPKSRDLLARLMEMPSQMAETDDDLWWERLIQDRQDAVTEITRLVKSRNKWGRKYNKLLDNHARKYKNAIEALIISQQLCGEKPVVALLVSVVSAIFEKQQEEVEADIRKARNPRVLVSEAQCTASALHPSDRPDADSPASGLPSPGPSDPL